MGVATVVRVLGVHRGTGPGPVSTVLLHRSPLYYCTGYCDTTGYTAPATVTPLATLHRSLYCRYTVPDTVPVTVLQIHCTGHCTVPGCGYSSPGCGYLSPGGGFLALLGLTRWRLPRSADP